MPELPEVETVRRGLTPAMRGARIDKVELRRADIRFPFPPSFAKRLTGQRILDLKRRAKYLLFELDGGETLIAHLGMSGSFRIEKTVTSTPGKFHHERSKDPKHDHVVLTLDNGWIVTFNDPRRFGFMDLGPTETLEQHPRVRGLGAEPLAPEFDAHRLAKLFAGSRAPLKSALLDQKRIAGLGNIYVSEALFRARLSPRKPASILANARGAPTKVATAGRRCAITGRPTANWAISSTFLRSTIEKDCHVRETVAAGSSPGSHSRGARLSTARNANTELRLTKRSRSLTRRGAAPISSGIPLSLRENGLFLPFSRFLLLPPSSAPPSRLLGRARSGRPLQRGG